MILIGRYLGERSNVINEFEKYNRLLLTSIPLYIVYANKVGIAGFYSDAFSTGFLITSRLYVIPIVVFLAIHYALSNKDKSLTIKCIDISFILINICMLLLSTRRTTLLMLAPAIMIYTFFNRRLFFKMLILLFMLVSALVISFPLYQDRLMGQLEKRERIENLNTYEEEGRYLETFYLINYHKKKGDLAQVLFGVNLFDTYSFGTRYFGRDRPIHSDINMIIFSTGIVGMFLFILFFGHYFLKGIDKIAEENKKLFFPLLFNFLIVLIPGRFIGTLTFPPLLMLLLAALKYSHQLLEVPEDSEEERLVISEC
jgi:O-antigen ligase